MRVCLFIGPSLAGQDVAQLCAGIPGEVTVLPPVQQGDLLRIAELQPTVVGIIDGVFFQVPSVSHKEILLTLERGVRVLGAASLGALRAAELDVFGMQGVGAVYRQYKSGAIDGDDEVAVLHGSAEDGYAAVTEPLVSIRHNVARARKQGVVSASTASAVVRAGKKLHFTRRTYRSVVAAAAGLAPAVELHALESFLRTQPVDLKRQDALQLLDLLRHPAPPPVERPTVHRTVYAHLFEREYLGRTVEGRYVSDSFVLSLVKLLSPLAVKLRRRAAWQCLAGEGQSIRALARQYGVSPLTLLRTPRMRPGIPWEGPLLDEARAVGEFDRMQRHARLVLEYADETAERLPGLVESLSCERLQAWASSKWGSDEAAFGRALVLRGFTSYREFVDVARLAYLYDWLGEQPSVSDYAALAQ